PSLAFQQAINQPDGSVPNTLAVQRWRAAHAERPWFNWMNKPQFGDPCLVTMTDLREWPVACNWSSDGRRILCCTYDGVYHLWDDQSYDLLMAKNLKVGRVEECHWSTDGRFVLIARSAQHELEPRSHVLTALSLTSWRALAGGAPCAVSAAGEQVVVAQGTAER